MFAVACYCVCDQKFLGSESSFHSIFHKLLLFILNPQRSAISVPQNTSQMVARPVFPNHTIDCSKAISYWWLGTVLAHPQQQPELRFSARLSLFSHRVYLSSSISLRKILLSPTYPFSTFLASAKIHVEENGHGNGRTRSWNIGLVGWWEYNRKHMLVYF